MLVANKEYRAYLAHAVQSSATFDEENEAGVIIPPPVLYRDPDGAHADAAKALVALARQAGTRSAAELLGDGHSKAFDEMLNPNLALPAAYMLATRLHALQESIPTVDAVALRGAEREFTALEARFQQIIAHSQLRETHKATHEVSACSPLGSLNLRDGTPSLAFALGRHQNAVMDQAERDWPDAVPQQEDMAVVCEALGRLCVEELGVRQGLPTPAISAASTTREGQLVLPEGRTK